MRDEFCGHSKTSEFILGDYFKDEDDILEFLNAAFEEAKGMMKSEAAAYLHSLTRIDCFQPYVPVTAVAKVLDS